jgi:polar amino acid transport system substrate-binding protein
MARTRTSLVLAALAVTGLALVACGSNDAGGTSTSATSPATSAGGASSSVSEPASGSGSASASASADQSSESPASGATSSSGSATSDIVGASSTGTAESSAASGACAPDKLQTAKAGTLTIATSEPAYEPWMVDDDPSNGKGFESAVAYAVADQLGFAKDAVTWKRVNFDEALNNQSGWDFDINQFTITDERKQAVDFSSGYYDLTQTVVTVKGSPIEKATTVAELKGAKLGAMVGTTSLNAINTVIQPDSKPSVFKSNDLAVQALQNGQIDGLVVDLPTAFYVVGAQVDNGVIVGQLPGTGSQKEQLGLLLAKGSPLTACVTGAVDTLRQDGTLDKLATTWLAGKDQAPLLK